MKKTLKILALAGALTLCLLLTGCYQPPDEVNNGLPNGGGQTAALFDTMPPTATVAVTPDTIVVETQNIYGPDYGNTTQNTPTPTPPESGGNGWDNWGTQPTDTPTPTPGPGQMIYFNTPVPSDGEIQPTNPDGTQNTIAVKRELMA